VRRARVIVEEFDPAAMVIAQALLATPIITALTHHAIEEP
jgi:ABC-type tungstate transport system substrate-binding protein